MNALTAEQRHLIERHCMIAERAARTHCRFGREDLADVRSDAFYGLTLAARSFRPGAGSFTAYAQMRAVGAIRRGRQLRSGLSRAAWESESPPRVVSLNMPVGNDGNAELGDLLPDTSETDDHPCALNDVLRRLPAREQIVVKLRYLRGLTQCEVAPVIGVSQMQVSRIERAALSRLRSVLAL